jgi:hypothetical protein
MASVKGTAVDASLRYGASASAMPRSPRSWPVFSSYYDTGEMKAIESVHGHAEIHLTGFAGARQFCERVHGCMVRALELSGARRVRLVHSACVHRGHPVCRFEAIWE